MAKVAVIPVAPTPEADQSNRQMTITEKMVRTRYRELGLEETSGFILLSFHHCFYYITAAR
jgi:hypothetical protein